MVQDANKLVVFGSQLLGVIIVVVGLWTQQANLKSPRPAGGKIATVAGPDRDEDRFARLWDDPFPETSELAVLKPPKGGASAATSAEPPAPVSPSPSVSSTSPGPEGAASPSPSPNGPPVKKLLIWNLVDPQQIPEIKERRLRIRYASVSAVLSADYLPARESSLTKLKRKPQKSSEAPAGTDIIGYFETFKALPNRKAPFERVILAWTPKDILPDAEMIEDAKKQIAARDSEDGEVTVRVLHHGSSQDLATYDAPKHPDLEGKISFMRATIAGEKFDRLRQIISDDRLIGALFDELSLRIPALNVASRPEKDQPRIVVVIEGDTRYSRAIKTQIQTRFADRAQLEFCSYLRGLDGRSENTADSTKTDAQEPSGAGFGESSLGTSQFDYLRRFAARLGSETNSRKGHRVSAIGILGSDIYDKMLVLQALQPQVPSAIFFTTDLDALYLERANQPYTRNLVVAGAEGLSLNPTLPPMRDGYQTVLANKVQSLVTTSHGGGSAATSTPAPKVFEIAPGRIINLHADGSDSSHTPLRDFVFRLLSYGWFTPVIFCLALINAFIILTAVFTRRPREEETGTVIAPMKLWARIFIYTEVFCAFAVMLYLLVFLGWKRDELLLAEPLAVGVSIWPSMVIRLLAFAVAILFLLIASYSFFSQGQGLKKKLQDALPEKEYPLPQGLAKESARLCASLARERPVALPLQKFQVHLDRFFGTQDKPFWGDARFWRIIGVSIAYFAISAFLFSQWQPSVPGRGAFTLLDEKIVLALGVTLYMIHLIFCLDLHVGALNFLRALRAVHGPAIWEEIRSGQTNLQAKEMLEATASFTAIIGRTLLYPLTVLILIVLSRLRHFDNWVMTPSLTITFALGALALITASLVLWLEGARLKRQVIANYWAAEEKARVEAAHISPTVLPDPEKPRPTAPPETNAVRVGKRAPDPAALAKELDAIDGGVFAAWYNQPIFAAIFSAAAVFGSLTVAGPIARLFLQ